MGEQRVTNLILSQKIDHIIQEQKDLKDYIKECNSKMDREIIENRNNIKTNAIAISGIKGAAGVISIIVSAISTTIISMLLQKRI